MSDKSDDTGWAGFANADLTKCFEHSAEDPVAAQARIFELAERELRVMARKRMANERLGHTLEPTDLVIETFLRVEPNGLDWKDRRHFFGSLARAMRRVLVDHHRKKVAQKRGGEWDQVRPDNLDQFGAGGPSDQIDMLALNEALKRLEENDPLAASVVHYRFFVSMTIEETAELLEIPKHSVNERWAFAKAWLHRELGRF